MFHADYFDFYSNFWNIRRTIGNSGGDPEGSIGIYYKKIKALDMYVWLTIVNFQK
tara:strand:- start:274 stop:438 length:165 start_codon:yes stop_codon:yes gene_type:complete